MHIDEMDRTEVSTLRAHPACCAVLAAAAKKIQCLPRHPQHSISALLCSVWYSDRCSAGVGKGLVERAAGRATAACSRCAKSDAAANCRLRWFCQCSRTKLTSVLALRYVRYRLKLRSRYSQKVLDRRGLEQALGVTAPSTQHPRRQAIRLPGLTSLSAAASAW